MRSSRFDGKGTLPRTMLSLVEDNSGNVDFNFTFGLHNPAKIALNSRACITPLSFFTSKSQRQFHFSAFVG